MTTAGVTRSNLVVAEGIWAISLLIVGVTSLAAGWSGWAAYAALVAAAVVPLVLVLVLGRRVIAPWAAALLVGALVIVGGHFALRTAGQQLTSVLTDALPRLLSGPSPAPSTLVGLTPGLLLAALGGTIAGLRLAVARHHRVTPVAVAIALYAAGLALTAGQGDHFAVLAVTLTVLAVVGWVWLGHPRPSRAVTRGAFGLMAMTIAATVGGAIPSRATAYDPRLHVHTPTHQVEAISPLPQLAAWGADPARVLFRVRGDAYPLHLVTLSTYTGATWKAPHQYVPFGTPATGALDPGPRRSVVHSDITVVDLGSPWLPAGGSPQTISVDGTQVDPTSGTILWGDPQPGLQYHVEGQVDAPSSDLLTAATVPTGPAIAAYLQVPDLPIDLANYARAVTDGATTPLAKALAIESAVRGSRTISDKAPTGSSYHRIIDFLLGAKGIPGAQQGTSEQFATSFVVLARISGLPTRLVVGFTPGDPPAAADGIRDIRAKDALAWPEVYFEGAGWVPFSPTPDSGRVGPDVRDTATASASPMSSAPPVTPPYQSPAAAAPAPTKPADLRWVPYVGGGAPLLAPFLVVWGLRWNRRGRHRRGGPTGAWAECVDALTLAGTPARPVDAADHLATVLETHLSPPRAGGALRVAAAANEAAFAPDPHPHEVWRTARSVSAEVRRSLPVWRRAWWAVDPRPLRRAGIRQTKRKLPADADWTGPTVVPDTGSSAEWAPVELAGRGRS